MPNPEPDKPRQWYRFRCFGCERDHREIPMVALPFIYGSGRHQIMVCLECLTETKIRGKKILDHPLLKVVRERQEALLARSAIVKPEVPVETTVQMPVPSKAGDTVSTAQASTELGVPEGRVAELLASLQIKVTERGFKRKFLPDLRQALATVGA